MKERNIPKKQMNLDKIKYLFFFIIILIFLAFAVYFLFFTNADKKTSENDEEAFFKCLSKISTLYLQKGCSYCTTQKNILGEGMKYLNAVDCMEEKEKCSKIPGTPTWIINGEMFIGVQSIEKLKSISSC